MPWIRTACIIEAPFVDAFSDALLERGAVSVDVAPAEDSEEPALYGEPDEPRVWPRGRVRALFDAGAGVTELIAAAAKDAGLASPPSIQCDTLTEQDWVRESRAQFTPIRVTERLWVVPTWHQPADACAINLRLDPGRAFGTGSHPSTLLCLRWLAHNVSGGETVLDYGCGSGILAIAALKLGASRAFAVDRDPEALLASRENAMQNRVELELSFPGGRLSPADIVIANILARPLIELAPVLGQAMRRGGRLALSGVLAAQAEMVIGSYAPWIALQNEATEDGWVLLAGDRSKS